MALKFREDKTTQAAARLLVRHGGKMSHMKLVKLLYFIDRKALLSWGHPITFDWYYSLDHGPILSFTLNLINDEPDPDQPSYWHSYISERDGHEVSLVRDAPSDQLSPAEQELIDEVFDELGHLNQWNLRALSHELPEWHDPEGSRLPIEIEDILQAEGLSGEEAAEIREALEAESAAERLLG